MTAWLIVDRAYNDLCQTLPAVQYLQHMVISIFHTKAKACLCTNFICRYEQEVLDLFYISDASYAFFSSVKPWRPFQLHGSVSVWK